jgi:hypothetical protein
LIRTCILKNEEKMYAQSISKSIYKFIYTYRKTPLLVPGEGQFSNANFYVLDQLIEETKTDLKSSISPLLSPILHQIIRRPNEY